MREFQRHASDLAGVIDNRFTDRPAGREAKRDIDHGVPAVLPRGRSQRLGRLATVGADGMPHVVPVAVFYDPEAEALVIGANVAYGEAVMTKSKKFRDAQRRPKVAVVVDSPSPRILEVRGEAETYLGGGEDVGRRLNAPFRFSEAWMRVRPRRIVAVGINGGHFGPSARDVG